MREVAVVMVYIISDSSLAILLYLNGRSRRSRQISVAGSSDVRDVDVEVARTQDTGSGLARRMDATCGSIIQGMAAVARAECKLFEVMVNEFTAERSCFDYKLQRIVSTDS